MQNPLSLRAFLSWVEKQPADKEYIYALSDQCACAQYAESIGMGGRSERLPKWRQAYYNGSKFWDAADDAAAYEPHTFGALASRLREQVQ